MCGALRVVPVEGGDSVVFSVPGGGRLPVQVTDLTASWRWANPVQRRHGGRPDGEVLLDGVAQE